MGFITWIVHRKKEPVKPEAQRPENAKQMYAREAAQETAGRTPLDRLPAEQMAKVDKIVSYREPCVNQRQ